MMSINPSLMTDGYKVDHRRQYGEGTSLVFSNLTARKSRIDDIKQVVFFGLQYFIAEYLVKQWEENFFSQPKDKVVAAYARRINNYLGPNSITFDHIGALHDLQYLPVEIRAVPEGSLVDIRLPMMVINNTLPEFFWLTNYLETILSCTVWGACTSATTAYEYKKILNKFADATVGNRNFVQWQGHDFSFRGMSSLESACISGAAHLLSFTGTDTIPAIEFLEQYYLADSDKELVGGSVAATEHSVMTMTAEYRTDGTVDEYESIKRLITEIYPSGIVSIVCDSFDYWRVITETLPSLKDEIMARDGKVVVRPDTGDPQAIICGDPLAEGPEREGTAKCLFNTFGGTKTANGYIMLDSHVGMIYGDSITIERCKNICQGLMGTGFCTDNIVFGIGSYTYQYVTRDTFGFAIKATYGEVNGIGRNIYKDPKTGDGIKKSAKGLLALYQNGDDHRKGYFLRECASWHDVEHCELKTVFKDGVTHNRQSLSGIRARLSSY